MPLLLDFESRSAADLKRVGGRRYWEHPSTVALCCVAHDTDDGARIIWTPGDGDAAEQIVKRAKAINWGAHNATGFDRFAMARVFGITRVDYIDTSELARTAGLPGALDALGVRWFGRDQGKDKAASAYTKSLSRQTKKQKAAGTWREIDWLRVIEYCDSDVDIMVRAWPRLVRWLTLEPEVVRADREINDRGICFDSDLARRLIAIQAELTGALVKACARDYGETAEAITAAARSPAQFAEATGLPDAQKQTIDDALVTGRTPDGRQMSEPGLALCRVRRALASIARGKLEAGLARVSDDGRLRDNLRYYGAHAQPLTERVHTPTGWIAMGDVRPGMIISGRAGPVCVRAVYPQGVRPTLRVHFSDGASVRCDADHLWSVRTLDGAACVRTTAQLLAAGLRRGNRCKFSVPLVTPDYAAPSARLPLDPYLLGALLGDGTLCGKTPRFTSADPEIANAFALPRGVRLRCYSVPGKRATWYRLSMPRGGRGKRNPVRAALESLGLWGRVSQDKFIPRSYLDADATTRLAVLRGLCDTDGSAKSPGVAKYATTSSALAADLIELVQSLGGTARASAERLPAGGGIWSIQLRLPRDVSPFALRRKASRYDSAKARPPVRLITAIEPAGSEPCQCIEVDAADRLYVTSEHVVTHNTGRWSGKGVQLQNLPRPHKDFDDWTSDRICEQADAVRGGASLIDGRLVDLLLRACFHAGEGKTLIAADFGSVEARALAWFALDGTALDAFRDGRDLYKIAAASIYGVDYDDVDKAQRQTGKVAELALGYQGGPGALRRMARAYGVDLMAPGIPSAEAIVRAWRRARPGVVNLWESVGLAFDDVARYGYTRETLGACTIEPWPDANGIAIFLPERVTPEGVTEPGRPIVYNDVEWRRDPETGRDELTYLGTRGREKIYGGKLVENMVQALCRDAMADAMIHANAQGWDVVLTVHDEIVSEVPKGTERKALAGLIEFMKRTPLWARLPIMIDVSARDGDRYVVNREAMTAEEWAPEYEPGYLELPLTASGFISDRYRK